MVVELIDQVLKEPLSRDVTYCLHDKKNNFVVFVLFVFFSTLKLPKYKIVFFHKDFVGLKTIWPI